MNLKSLELFGFKSFMRKLDIHFSDGITVIVGPNGCGKTNVTDALRWVLGEGNARTLRGTKMEDLIFNGTRDYKPLNVAEVSLTVDNSSGVLPIEYSEVTVTRRVYRNGEPEFLINKVPGRLRDIHDLFMDTGLGSRAYSVIERDMVEMVLADQPEKRRELLEEAAGIMKYKIRERQARRKLEATDEDMNRIEDVLREVERQVRALKRQVGAARRFQEMRDRQRELEVALAAVELSRTAEEAMQLETSVSESLTERDGAASHVAALEADIESRRLGMAEADRALSDIQREVDAVGEETRKLESENLVRRERREALVEKFERLGREVEELRARIASAAERRTELDTEHAACEEQLRELEVRLRESEDSLANVESDLDGRRRHLTESREAGQEAARELARRRAELANLDAHREHLEDRDLVLAEELREIEHSVSGLVGDAQETGQRVDAMRGRLQEITQRISDRESLRDDVDRRRDAARREESRLAADLEATRSGLDMLRGLQESWEGFGQGARSLLSRNSSQVRSLADGIRLSRNDLLRAVDSAMDAAVQFVTAPTSEVAVQLVRSLEEGEGQVTVVDVAGFARAAADAPIPLPQDGAVIGRASDFVEADGELSPVLERLLMRSVIVETLDDAVRLAGRAETRGLRFVSRHGEWAEYPGVVHGGKSAYGGESSILGRAERIQDLTTRVAQQEIALGEVRALEERLSGERESLAVELDALHRDRDATREQLSEQDRLLERSRAAHAAAEKRLASVTDERRALAARREEVVRQRDVLGKNLDELEETRARHEDETRRRETELVASGEDRDRLQTEVHDRKLERQRLRADLERLDLERSRLEESRRADEEGIARRLEDIQNTESTSETLAREIEESYSAFAARAEHLEERRRVRDDVARDRAGVIDALREVENERNKWQRLRDEA
ncbi:MAG: chromosome segregation protein SMC, partial [Gemmatimonadetes bacterium]|nr:chromosome segregation protein SMC [Gemmatimonadota bacterium]